MELKPLIYTDRPDYSPEDHYVFISYSHKDSDVVYSDLDKLYELGVKFWYDKGLEVGSEVWFSQVEKRIRDPRCVAVIFYLSPYVFVSESIEREIKLLKNSDGEEKSYFSVNIGAKNTTELFDDTVELPAELKSKRNSKRTMLISETFDDDYPYIPRSTDPKDLSHMEELYEKLKKYNITSEQNVRDLELMGYEFLNHTVNSNGIRTVQFGNYPQSEVKMFSMWKKDLVSVGQDYYERVDAKYKLKNDKYFHVEPILWRVLKYEDKKLTLLSDKCLDSKEYHDEPKPVYWEEAYIRKWLNESFLLEAFSSEERSLLVDIDGDLVTMPLLEELMDTSLTFDSTPGITPTRESMPTDYAMEQGAYSGPTGTCYWWYKMPFGNASISPFVYDNGGLLNYSGAFRIMIKLDLSKADK